MIVRQYNFRLWVASHRWPLALMWLVLGVALQFLAR